MSDSPWTFAGESAGVGRADETVTLVEGSSFCVGSGNGDIRPGSTEGLYFLDTRFLSKMVLLLDGERLQGLSVATDDPSTATFLARITPEPERPDGTIAVFRRRFVGSGLVERITVRNYGAHTRTLRVELELDADFADLFAVKEGRRPVITTTRAHGDDGIMFDTVEHDLECRTQVHAKPAPTTTSDAGLTWLMQIEPRAEVQLCIDVTGTVTGELVEPRYSCDQPSDESRPARSMAAWRAKEPVIDTDAAALRTALQCSSEDLASLRLVDPDHPDDVVVAAGAPWFMTLFGRDSIITSYMALMIDPSIALGVLRTLARLQGREVNPDTEEQPGRVLHEVRFHDRPTHSFADGTLYFGTVDATPLFVVLLGELRRWGLEAEAVDELLVHADRALQWIEDFGDADGDGYVEHERTSPRSLVNQGWKDSPDGITFADGRIPEGPIALCEVQGYVYAAYLARAFFALEQDDHERAARYTHKAATLKEAFNRDFWLPDRGWFAAGLDGDKQPIDSLASNMGHCLWSGIIDEDKAPSVAEHLLSPEMFNGWGVRTLAASMAAYDPLSYHNGSVWPHDNAIIAAGLVRYGFTEEAHRIIGGMLDASTFTDGRLPELLSGIGRDELSVPAVYPTSCMPQAWAAASPFLFLRTLLRFDPWIPRRMLWVAPLLPRGMRRLRVAHIPVDGARVTVESDSGELRVTGAPADVQVVVAPRAASTAAFD